MLEAGRAEGAIPSTRLLLRRFLEIAVAAVPAIPIPPTIPATIGSPGSPFLVIVPLAVGISRIPVLAIGFLRGMARAGDHVLGHCGPCEHGTKNYGSAKQSEFGHDSENSIRRGADIGPHFTDTTKLLFRNLLFVQGRAFRTLKQFASLRISGLEFQSF